ncbi:unannotated protein [freshwater metagenome]|uniref:Unannotated protein n=1 Tax=freshwater metagenome TaxID=449393 RepID=A0A6J7IHW9_9ZZZZ|nr:hypothetical protein [Actinomycetota bacterium]
MAAPNDHLDGVLTRLAGIEAQVAAVRHDLLQLREALEVERAVPAIAPVDVEGARLVALDLLLSETQRDVAEQRLRASFPGVDAAAMLDDAAATLGD